MLLFLESLYWNVGVAVILPEYMSFFKDVSKLKVYVLEFNKSGMPYY